MGVVVDAGPDGYSILAQFSRPRTLADAFAALETRADAGGQLVPGGSAIVELIATGAIVESDPRTVRYGWADPVEHARMLHDVRRTRAYLAAITAAVGPDDVVLDVGTGSGILAVAAAHAGARRVYAIEASDIADVAAQVFEANDVADRVTLIGGWSTDLDIPERATVLVSEIIGSDPLEEDILEVTLDARRRLLAPGAQVIPRRLRLFTRPLAVPEPDRWAGRIDERALEEWRASYGIDLRPLWEGRRTRPVHWPTDGTTVARWTPLGPAGELLSIDLTAFASAQVRAQAELVVEEAGTVDAILVTFSAQLHDGIELVGEPRPLEASSWSSSVWFLPDPIEAPTGTRLRVEYRRRIPGQPDGLTCEAIL